LVIIILGWNPTPYKRENTKKNTEGEMKKTKEEAQYEERTKYNRRWDNTNKDPTGLRKASPLSRLHKVMQKTWNTAIPKEIPLY
jgi:hypothetical protein